MISSAVGGGIIGAIAGAIVSTTIKAAFTDEPDSPNPSAALDQEAQGRLVTVRQAVSPWDWVYGQIRKGGIITFIEQSSDNQYLHLVITFAGHECDEIGDIYFEDEVVPLDGAGNATGRYAGFVRVFKSLGNEAAGVQPFPQLQAASASKWTAAHCQTGRAKIHVELLFNADLFPSGIPNITAVIKGRKVYDPRTGLTVWADNAPLCITDYLTTGRNVGLACVYASEVYEAQVIAAANVADEDVALAAGGTEKRYTCNGTFKVNTTPREIIGRLNTSIAGPTRFLGGMWAPYPAVYETPTITLTQDDLRGPLHVMPRLSRRELANAIKGIYVSPENNYQASDFPPITNAAYLAEDQGERIWRELDLPYTNTAARAQRIGKVELERIRQQGTIDWPGKLSCFRLQPGSTVMVTLDRYGFSAKVYEVTESSLVHEEGDGGIRLGCDLVLRETASQVFDWSSGEETIVDPAPDTNLPNPFVVGVPGTPSIAEALYETTGSAGVKSRATVSWAQSADRFVQQGGFYELEFKLVAASTWERVSPITALFTTLDDLAPGSYHFRVRASNSIGVHSSYSDTVTKELLGLTSPPAAPAGFFVTVHEGRARMHVTKSADLDVKIGGRLWVRWSPLTTGAIWNDGALIKADGYPGDTVVCEGPLYAGTYMAKFQDSAGNFSASEASFVVAEALLTGFATLSTLTFHPTFAGTYSSVIVIDSALQLAGGTLWDSMAGNMDTWGLVDSLGGLASSGSATFTSKMDLGSVQTVRLFPALKTLAFDTGDLWDTRTGLMDDWGLVDGSVIEDAEIQPQVRITSDNPSGSPSWGPWHNLEVSDYTARGFEFRTVHTSGNVTHNRKLLELSVAAKQFA